MPDRLQGKVYIESWPVKMFLSLTCDVQYSRDGRFLEPREFVKREEQLFLVDQ
jgi:hypothetical protein